MICRVDLFNAGFLGEPLFLAEEVVSHVIKGVLTQSRPVSIICTV